MTSREHARRLLLVLLANERREAAGSGTDAQGAVATGRGEASDASGTDAADDGRDTGDPWRMWTPPPTWGTARSP
ncbi:MAG: hypothetical protein QOI62_1941 [Solirubrobacteraceae bacterium]|jgi:hypothetical protein|nr:hypothetical protein [Solirubrobacteraceae bacterium]MEA2358681.1 hypothetical protein [Solirubrobacteraceae bacterium]MEA2395524.1 hypothetical protein [Solirubrobacteraceae bacterium]